MVTTKKITAKNAVGMADYLTELASRGDYYVTAEGEPWEPRGEWRGLADEQLRALGLDPG